jgi:CRP-like cAMP-binding protein
MTQAKKSKDLLTKVEFKAGHVVFDEGQEADALYVIDGGSVQLNRLVHTQSCKLETLGVGDVFGEQALFPATSYPCTAIVVERTTCLRVPGAQFEELIKRSPEVASRFLKKLSARLIHHQFRLANFSLRAPLARLMHQLRAEVMRAEDRRAVPLPYDLPDVLCMERGAIDRMFRGLIRERLVEMTGQGTFALLDPAAFERYLTYLELKDRFEDAEQR